MFIHLHNHSHFSILEWLPKPKDYVKKAKELWMTAVALTDTSNIHGCHEFYKECKSEWIKPILWTEIYMESSLDSTLNHKLVLLAKNLEWYRNIISLTSKASLNNPWTLAKIIFDDLIWKTKDVICLSWPLTWEISYYILSWKTDEEILLRIKEYQKIFWEENYFLELMYHDDIPKQKLVTDKLINLHKNYNIPVVATNNCFYVNLEDKKTQDVIQALWTGHEIENPDRPTLINWDYSFLTEESMEIMFWFIPEALSNTVKIADTVNIYIETGGILIPTFELPEEDGEIYNSALEKEKDETWLQLLSSSEWYLRYLSFKWLNWRFDYKLDNETIFEFIKKLDKPSLEKRLQDTTPEELKKLSLTYYTDKKKELLKKLSKDKRDYIERLEYELVVIHEMWFDAYFLIVADYINWARNNNIPVWPWRWSAAGSVMAYLSWITDLDPIKYWLLFERFLNPARVSMPDIDTDFADNERDLVVDYCREKYWNDKVAQICTFWTFAARAAVKDVGRVMWVPFSEMNALVKLMPEKPWTKLKDAIEEVLEFKEEINNNPKYKEIIDNALRIEWNVRQLWVHACAVIIAPEPMTNFTALQHPPKDTESIITQYSAYPLEDLWLLKMDFLWLRNLTIIKRAVKIIKRNKWLEVDVLNLNMEDSKTFKIFAAWDTTWVFQFESDGMRKYLSDLWPNTFEDIIVMVSLYRPWPIKYIPTYIDRKHWKEKVKYAHKSLEKILSPTQWIAVYQEQIMQMVQAFAWFSLWEADILRRAIWKKKIKLLMEQKNKFLKAAKEIWHDEKLSLHIFEDVIEPFAWYGFNKSHAACYAFIAYQTAYLKAYYPSEFLTSVMVSDEENMERIVLEVSECESKWISVLPPSVNESLKHFTYINDKNIRFWLKAIKWIWNWPIDKIKESREQVWWKFDSLEQFIEISWTEVINKRTLESLILSGALDDLWNRKQMFESIQNIIRFCKKDEKKKETNQVWLFDNSEEFKDTLELLEVWQYSFEENLKWEKESIGFYVSGHPLDGLGRYCARRSSNVVKLKKSMDELLEEDKKNNPDKYIRKEIDEIKKLTESEEEEKEIKKEKKEVKEKRKEEIVQVVWVIIELRKIVTKMWKPMMFLKCEWFDYDFEVVLFSKDIDKYAEKIDEAKIIIVSWILNINFEYWRRSINIRNMQVLSISSVRNQAKDLWLFDDQKRYINRELNKVEEYVLPLKEDENNNPLKKVINKYVIKIPDNAKKNDLHELKKFLLTLNKWDIQIYINLKWQEIFTKIWLKSLEELKKWINKN